MKSSRKPSRLFFALSLVISLSVAPTLTVFAQQTAKKQPVVTRLIPPHSDHVKNEKTVEFDESVPLSDAEMEKIQGGIPAVIPVAIGAAGLAVGLYNAYRSNRAHRQLMEACLQRSTRRR